jgi:hypothetical protein
MQFARPSWADTRNGRYYKTRDSDAIPEVFGRVPEIAGAVMREEAEAVWRDWHPMIWRIITFRGCFGGVAQAPTEVPRREGFFRRLTLLHR